MPPKKSSKSASTFVLGTVSTRSTRRQSVVNIDIPKTSSNQSTDNKRCKKSLPKAKTALTKPQMVHTKRNLEAPEGRRPATVPLKKDLRARKYLVETIVKKPPKVALQEIIDEWTSDDETQDDSDKVNTDRETISDDNSNFQATSKQDSESQNLVTTETSHLSETMEVSMDTQETIQEHITEIVEDRQDSEDIIYKFPLHIKVEDSVKTEDTDSDSDRPYLYNIITHIKTEPEVENDHIEPFVGQINQGPCSPGKECKFLRRNVVTEEKTVQTDQIGEEFFTATEGSQDFQPVEVIVRNEGDSNGSQTETSNDTFENVPSIEEVEVISEEKLIPEQAIESLFEEQITEEQVVIESNYNLQDSVIEHKDVTTEEQMFYSNYEDGSNENTDSNCEKIMEEQVTDEDHNETVNNEEVEDIEMIEEEVNESNCDDHNHEEQYNEEQVSRVVIEEQDSNCEAQTADIFTEEQIIESETKEEVVETDEPILDFVEQNLQALNDGKSVFEEKIDPEITDKPEDNKQVEDKIETTEICTDAEVARSTEFAGTEILEKDLERKVAELHLKDPEAPDEVDVMEKVAELNLNAMEMRNIESLEKILSENLPPEPTVEDTIVEPKKPARPQRTRRTKSAEPKQKPTPKPKESKPKVSKEPKAMKARERKPKTEPKEARPKEKKSLAKTTKKLPATKKPKDTPEAKPEDTQKEKKPPKTESKDKPDVDLEDIEVRRSSRIKSISVLNKKMTGRGVVKSKSEQNISELEMSDSNSTFTESEKSTPSVSPKPTSKERKTRWNKPDNGTGTTGQPENQTFAMDQDMNFLINNKPNKTLEQDPVVEERLKQYVHLKENHYKTDRLTCKEAKKMTCDCFLTPEEIQGDEYGCGEDCLNRLLLIECGELCPVGDRCTNKRFQKGQCAPVEVFNTEKKGLGLRAAANIPYGEFILEYIGEVLDINEFDKRAEVYSQDKNIHYYFMALRADAIIDATMKGNISRFINHSCDPNAETQKWTVNGQLRIGFFSTRTIFAGEEITFDYQFQRYGKEAQKCFCEASICRGWLGEQPDSEEEEDEEDEEDEEEEAKVDTTITEGMTETQLEQVLSQESPIVEDIKTDESTPAVPAVAAATFPVKVKRKVQKKKKKARIELFEEIDQLNEEIEMLMTTGLKNQTQTLKLSRLMVRAQEPQQRQKLLRVLRRGELPCKRLFLDYHGLRLMHGYLIDAQHLVKTDRSYESIRLELLQTLAVLPIANKTMLKDSKVLSTVEKWAADKALTSPLDSDSNSPMIESDSTQVPKKEIKVESDVGRSIEEQEEEIRFLASKLLEEWSNLKEVFRIPKKERIEQMKEHEREANKKFMQNSYGLEQDKDKKGDRYRTLSRLKLEKETIRNKSYKGVEKYSAEFLKLSKFERRKLFALQHELKEEERRLKQREMWRQHEINCMMIGTDPRFTAPFDPSKPFQFIWNPQIGQWQSYPLPQNSPLLNPQHPMQNMMHMSHMPKTTPYQYSSTISQVATVPQMNAVMPTVLSSHSQVSMQLTQTQVNPLSNLHSPLQQNLTSIPNQYTSQVPLGQYSDQKINEEDDLSQVKFLGPIPPPVTLPPKWKCAKDKYGRPYYYHIKLRKSQWEPPPFPEPAAEEPGDTSESESSSDTSSLSSDSSSENTDSEDEMDDTKLLIEVRRQMEKTERVERVAALPPEKPPSPEEPPEEEDSPPTAPATATPSPDDKNILEDMEIMMEQEVVVDETAAAPPYVDDETERPTSIDIRLKEQFNLLKEEQPARKKRRLGLCEEIIIPPRTQEDIIQSKEDLKRYKANKEKVRKQKELLKKQKEVTEPKRAKEKQVKEKPVRTSLKVKIKDMPEFNSEAARKIKETFRANMASTVVNSLNFYRKPDCSEGKITNIEDFKHLARKLTHFVMLKEMKHIARIEDLLCTDNVKMKARDYIRKYMSKFGEVYIKRSDSPDFKD